MKGGMKLHQKCQDNLEARLREKYPHQHILTNFEYTDAEKTIGEVDILRFISPKKAVMYEVKTSVHGHLHKVKRQYRRFCNYFPELEVKGVYYHPCYGVQRMG